MTGLDKITSQIQEEAEASAKERIEAKNRTAADQAGNYRGGHWKSL